MIKGVIILLILLCINFGENIRPSNGASLNYVYVPFEWEQEPDAVYYNLQVEKENTIIIDIIYYKSL